MIAPAVSKERLEEHAGMMRETLAKASARVEDGLPVLHLIGDYSRTGQTRYYRVWVLTTEGEDLPVWPVSVTWLLGQSCGLTVVDKCGTWWIKCRCDADSIGDIVARKLGVDVRVNVL